MFELTSILKSGKNQDNHNDHIKTVLFYQTKQCKNLFEESFRFEGITVPIAIENKDENIVEHVKDKSAEIIIIELNNSKSLVADAERISHLIPTGSAVVIVGGEDAMSTMRGLKKLGFYYLFWPATKPELVEFINSIYDERERPFSVSKGRKAKRISIVGAKGGVGTTMVTAELSCLLAETRHSSSIIVDHNYNSGNLDIMLGINKFEKKKVQKGALSDSLDVSSSRSLLVKKSNLLSILSISAEEFSYGEMVDYRRSIINVMRSECNFIVEDISASTGQVFDFNNDWMESDCIVIVTNATVSSLRDAGRLNSIIEALPTTERPRVFIVVNHTMPEKYASVSFDEIEKFLKRKVDLVIPYIKDFSDVILDGKRLATRRHRSAIVLNQLSSLVLGEDINAKKSFFKKIVSKG